MPNDSPSITWSVLSSLRHDLGDLTCSTWFGSMAIDATDAPRVVVHLATKFLKTWCETHYAKQILSAVAQHVPDAKIEFATRVVGSVPRGVVIPPVPMNMNGEVVPVKKKHPDAISPIISSSPESIVVHDTSPFMSAAPINDTMTFEKFVACDSNSDACTAAKQMAAGTDTAIRANPLYIYGDVGLGKTHLLQAIANDLIAQGKTVLYLTVERFMFEFVQALRKRTATEFKSFFDTIDVLLMDDIQFLKGPVMVQEFGHVLNAFITARKRIVVVADRAPMLLDSADDRLRSRVGGGLAIRIKPLSFQGRVQFLNERLERMVQFNASFRLSPVMIDRIATMLDASPRDLEGALNRLAVAHANEPLSLDSIDYALSDMVGSPRTFMVRIEDIIRATGKFYNVQVTDIISSRRTANVVKPRQVAMLVSRVLTHRSLPEIGRRFGGRDHTTVLHASNKMAALYHSDEIFRSDIESIFNALQVPNALRNIPTPIKGIALGRQHAAVA